MNVKLIAVDMDGTFLTNNNEYDQERFTRQYEFMKEKGIHFVVASGNQYYQLRSFCCKTCKRGYSDSFKGS